MGNNSVCGLDKLLKEFASYKGFIVKITALMFHSNNMYSENMIDKGDVHKVHKIFACIVDYTVQIFLVALIVLSCISIMKKIYRDIFPKKQDSFTENQETRTLFQ